jgi:hypothetical protein
VNAKLPTFSLSSELVSLPRSLPGSGSTAHDAEQALQAIQIVCDHFECSVEASITTHDGKRIMCSVDAFRVIYETETVKVTELRAQPIPMVLHCPNCKQQHLDVGEWRMRAHRTHLCLHCQQSFTPSKLATVGVEAL